MKNTPINWVKSICIVKQGNKLLVSRYRDNVKNDYYYRPLGGSIDFRERSADAVKREFFEELGATLANLKLLSVTENIFTMDGQDCHEIDFIYQGDIKEKTFYEKEKIEFMEGKDKSLAMWIDYEEFTSGRKRLVPEELFKFIDI